MTTDKANLGGRDISLDILKGILTFLIITTHMVSFFPFQPMTYASATLTNIYVAFVCLTAFSSFMLILGYMCFKAYISKSLPKVVLGRKMLKSFVKTMLSYYASALAYVFFIRRDLTAAVFKDILLLRYVVEYSEFILSFAFIYVLVFFFDRLLWKLTGPAWAVLSVLSLLSTFFPYGSVKEPLLAVFTGSTIFSSFSIFQYFCYFITGIYFAKSKMGFNKWLMLISAAGTAGFVGWRLIFHDYPSRFPPSLLWIAGGMLFVYCGFLLCRHIPVNPLTKLLAVMGKDSLYYMLFSNIVLFALRKYSFDLQFNPQGLALIVFYIFAFALCAAAAYGYTRLLAHLKKA